MARYEGELRRQRGKMAGLREAVRQRKLWLERDYGSGTKRQEAFRMA